MHNRETLSPAETAQTLGVGTKTILRGVANGDIPAVRLGRRLLIPRAYIDRLVAAAMAKMEVAND